VLHSPPTAVSVLTQMVKGRVGLSQILTPPKFTRQALFRLPQKSTQLVLHLDCSSFLVTLMRPSVVSMWYTTE
jgi:hypothetical protein